MSEGISILVMAAGGSSRMKTAKQLLPWKGTTLIEHVLSTALNCKAQKVYVMLGAHFESIAAKLTQMEVSLLKNEHWESGLGESIATGVRAILKREDPEGILLLLGDQPLITTSYLDKLIDAFLSTDKNIAGTGYPSKTGVPVIFGPSHYDNLSKLKDDQGAWTLISKNQEDTLTLDAGKCIRDLDTPEDYRLLS